MPKREGLSFEQLLWEIHKQNNKVEKSGKRYDQDVAALTVYVEEAKLRFPERWQTVINQEKRQIEQIKQSNEAWEAKKVSQEEKLEVQGAK